MSFFAQAAAAPWTAIGNWNKGSADIAAAKYNQARAGWAGQNARIATQVNEQTLSRDFQKGIGGVRAAYGASGVKMDGTPQDVMEADSADYMNKVLALRYQGEMKAQGFNQEAQLYGMQAEAAKQARWINSLTSLMGAGAGIAASTYGGSGMPSSGENITDNAQTLGGTEGGWAGGDTAGGAENIV